VVNTLGGFNRADAIYETVKQLDIENLVVTKSCDYSDFLISDKDIANFEAKNDYEFHKVLESNTSFDISGTPYHSYDYNLDRTLKTRFISGVMKIDNNVLSKFKLNLIQGVLPEAENEICISANLYNTIIESYAEINSLEDLQTKEFVISSNRFKVSGVIKDNTDISKFKDLDGTTSNYQTHEKLYDELEDIIRYGFVNMCYLSETGFNAYRGSKNYNHYNYNSYVEGKEDDVGYYGTEFNKASYYITNPHQFTYSYLQDGKSIENLTGTEAIVSRNYLINSFFIPADELEQKIKDGLTINFCAGYEGKKAHAFSLKVVGVLENSSNQVLISDEHYNDFFTGADYILTRLKGGSSDKSLIRTIENFNSVFDFKVECPATKTLDQFGSFISGAAKIFLYIGIGLAVFAGFMLMNFISTSISYKKREIGVLRAIGARGKDVFSIFFAESFVICMINFVLSWIACAITCSLINSGMNKVGIDLVLMMFGPQQIVLLFGISLFVAFISCFLPVFKFARKNPIDSINNR